MRHGWQNRNRLRIYARLGKTDLAEAASKKHAELTEAEREAIGSGLAPLAQP